MSEKDFVFHLTEAEAREILEILLLDGAEQNRAIIDKVHAQLFAQGGSFAGGGGK